MILERIVKNFLTSWGSVGLLREILLPGVVNLVASLIVDFVIITQKLMCSVQG
jgi:hypothetical protein